MKKIIFLVAILLIPVCAGAAYTVYLKNGSVISVPNDGLSQRSVPTRTMRLYSLVHSRFGIPRIGASSSRDERTFVRR